MGSEWMINLVVPDDIDPDEECCLTCAHLLASEKTMPCDDCITVKEYKGKQRWDFDCWKKRK
jgi:hypothetical protein